MGITMNSLNGERKLQKNRKYKAFWGVFLMATLLAVLGKLTSEWVTVMGTTYGLFMAGNVGEHWTNKDK